MYIFKYLPPKSCSTVYSSAGGVTLIRPRICSQFITKTTFTKLLCNFFSVFDKILPQMFYLVITAGAQLRAFYNTFFKLFQSCLPVYVNQAYKQEESHSKAKVSSKWLEHDCRRVRMKEEPVKKNNLHSNSFFIYAAKCLYAKIAILFFAQSLLPTQGFTQEEVIYRMSSVLTAVSSWLYM